MTAFNPIEAARLAEMYVTNHEWCSAARDQLRAACAEVERLHSIVDRHNDEAIKQDETWCADRDRLAARVAELERLCGDMADDFDRVLAAHDPEHPGHRSHGGQHHNGPCCSFGNVNPGSLREFRSLRDRIRAALKGGSK